MAKGKEKASDDPNRSVADPRSVELSSDLPTDRSIVEQKRDIYAVVESDDRVGLSTPVKILLGLAVLTLLFLVWYVYHSIHLTQTHDANLEEKILSGQSVEGLKALKQHSLQALSTIFILVLVFVVIVAFIGFGYLMFHNETLIHRERKIYQVVRKATEAVDIQETKLSAKLNAEMSVISRLESNIKEREMEIEELSKSEERNEEEIRRLEEEKSEKVAELNEASERLEEVQKDLEEAREHKRNLKDNVEKEAQSKRELEQELVDEKARTTKEQADLTSEANKLKADLSKERSETKGLRSRVTQLGKRVNQLEAENEKLKEEVAVGKTWSGWLFNN